MHAEAQDAVLEINTHKRGAEIAPTMYGVFFEDINYGADGGLYGELVKNRSFEFPQPLMGWNTIGGVTVKDDGPFSRCPHYVRLSYSGKRDMTTGIENEGFLGMSLNGGEQYRFTVWARVPEDSLATLNVGLRDLDSQEENFTVCEADINVCGSEWHKYTLELTPPHTIKRHLL
jgi:alpha-L-arabinofuranosidase A